MAPGVMLQYRMASRLSALFRVCNQQPRRAFLRISQGRPTKHTFGIQLASHDPSNMRLTVRALSGDEAEQLSDVLLGCGAQSVVVNEHRPEGAPERPIFDDGTNASELWELCSLEAYFPMEHDMEEARGLVRAVLERDIPIEVEEVVPQEWIDTIKASYVPLKVVEGVWIVPEWSEPEEPTATNIILQPGVAFGTGEHPTTKLCLRHLLSIDLQGLTVMDYGCGSGVLALGAILRGASDAVCVDADPLAVRATTRNAQLNGVSERLQALACGPEISDPEPLQESGLGHRTFDIVVANILRGPLLELRPRLTSYTRPGGRLVMSGVLTEQAADIATAYGSDFEGFTVSSLDGWALLTATRRT